MAKSNGDRDSDHAIIFALLLLSAAIARIRQEWQIAPLRRGVPGYPLVQNNDGDGKWKDLDDVLAMPSSSADLRIPPNIDPEGQYNGRLVDQPPSLQEPMPNIDADNARADEADLEMLLAVAEIVSLPRQIERDEENMMVRRPQEPPSVVESGEASSSLADDGAAPAAPAPEVVGILAGVQPRQIEDKGKAHAEAQEEVVIEAFPPLMLERISEVPRFPHFATPGMIMPAGGVESNLEERVPVNHQEGGHSPTDSQAEENKQDDVENLVGKEPHSKCTQ